MSRVAVQLGISQLDCYSRPMHKHEVGERVREVLDGRQQKEVAAEVGMTPDAFSRSLKGERAFSTLELTELSGVLGADLHWLITGAPDPRALALAARHAYDSDRRVHHLEGSDGDTAIVDDVALAFRQVAATGEVPISRGELPGTVEGVRDALGEGFVETFVRRVQEALDVDVVVLPGLSTDYSFVIEGRRVVLLRATANWFRANFSLGHELAHLVLGHHDEQTNRAEQDANDFAAQLLAPEAEFRAIDWTSPAEVAELVWRLGISTQTVRIRLGQLGIEPAKYVAESLELGTRTFLLQQEGLGVNVREAVIHRMERASRRRFPSWLEQAHTEAVRAGSLGAGTLEWMLGVEAGDLSSGRDERPPMDPKDLAAALGF